MGEHIAEGDFSPNLPCCHPHGCTLRARVPPDLGFAMPRMTSRPNLAAGSCTLSSMAPAVLASPSPVAIMLQAVILYEIFGSHL